MPSRARTAAQLVGAAAAAGAYCVTAQLPLWWSGEFQLAAANALVTAALAAAALLVCREPGHRSTACGLLLAALIWPLNWANIWEVGPWPALAALIGPAALLAGGWSLLRYPAGLPPGAGPRLAVAFTVTQLAAVLPVLTSRPQWQGAAPDVPWPTLWPDPTAYEVARLCSGIIDALVTVAMAVAIVVRLRHLEGPDRQAMRPVQAAVIVAAVLTIVSTASSETALATSWGHLVYAAQTTALILIPVAFFVSAARRWLTRESTPALVRDLVAAATPAQVQDVLRAALGDASLRIVYDVDGSIVDVDGAPAALSGGVRCLRRIPTRSADVLLLSANPLLSRYGSLVSAATVAASLTLDNTALQARLRATLRQVEDSAERIRAAVDAERRHVDGAVEDLVADHLTPAHALVHGPDVPAPLGVLAADLAAARDELTDLARGGVPAAILHSGWARAVQEAIEQLPLPEVTCRVTPGPLPVPLQHAVYFIVMELAANAVKHAGATRLHVTVAPGERHLVIQVVDDGRGGATLTGSGLRGVTARVDALGGQIALRSTPGQGTDVRVTLPLDARGQ